MKYHLTAEGPAKCKARFRCPLGGEHFTSLDKAWTGHEAAMTAAHGTLPPDPRVEANRELLQSRRGQELLALASTATSFSRLFREDDLRDFLDRAEAAQATLRDLPGRESYALWTYTDDSTDYQRVNEGIGTQADFRQGVPYASRVTGNSSYTYGMLVDDLDSAIEKAGGYGRPRPFYRGLRFEDHRGRALTHSYQDSLGQVGAEVAFPSFTSTAHDFSTARQFITKGQEVVLELVTDKGLPPLPSGDGVHLAAGHSLGGSARAGSD